MFFFQEGLFRVRWTDIILDEWTRNLMKNRPEKRDSIQNQEAKMRETFPGALVTGFEQHIAGLELPDPDDRHVLAAAIQCGAQYIVTENQRDFPREYLAQFSIEPMRLDDFLGMICDLYPKRARKVLLQVKGNYRNPSFNIPGFIKLLDKNNMGSAADRLRTSKWLSVKVFFEKVKSSWGR